MQNFILIVCAVLNTICKVVETAKKINKNKTAKEVKIK
ncbi:hypothetical protein UABAM_03038 [Candidatus Uabimicrobium amorphum]|uniref:Uncharacterized protein n=1 Tax=Uabimicrobium amorphum TaxID=2596890 RepID=A0A5S9INB0_UABAM|nr:hypothetical protein UABAM_03038 [Candidatus Uabimicrobium amorphum]